MENINVKTFLESQDKKDQIRFITCGSVDDGKSTLIGRLLYDSKTVFEDQLLATHIESKKYGTQGENIDLALLVDGLQAEREQSITIDVAYRFFETQKRKFIATDTPGHEQYTRNMATGASTADLAVILIDAKKGMLTQTKRHSFIVSLLGIKHIIVAVNKMDLLDYNQAQFEAIKKETLCFTKNFNFEQIHFVPLCALNGDNVFKKMNHMPWYQGQTLIELLENTQIESYNLNAPWRLPVQWVNRPNTDFRGFSGIIASGMIKVGEQIITSLSAKKSKVKRILAPSGEVSYALAKQSISLVLEDEIDISRGELLTKVNEKAQVSDQFASHIIWMNSDPLLPERSYFIKFATAWANVQITNLVHKIDVNNLQKQATKTLNLNEVGYCKLAVDKLIAFDPYQQNRQTGAFILIDKFNNETVGAGVIDFALRRASNIEWHSMKINKKYRAKNNNQKPIILWFTGLSGSGKSMIADSLEQKLNQLGKKTYILDGDNIRHGLNKDLGFTNEDRVENIRRVGEVAKLMLDAGLIVLVSFISPFRSERVMVRNLVEKDEFVEIFVDTPIEVCENRDSKGLYKKARAGELKNFTGIDSVYEKPQNAEIVLKAEEQQPEQLVQQILDYLKL